MVSVPPRQRGQHQASERNPNSGLCVGTVAACSFFFLCSGSSAGWLLAIASNADDEGRAGTLVCRATVIRSANSCQLRQFLTFVFDSPRVCWHVGFLRSLLDTKA